MTARSHSRILRRPGHRRTIRTPFRDTMNAWELVGEQPPWLRRAQTLDDVTEPEPAR